MDIHSRESPFTYALGPSKNIASNAPDAGLGRHAQYGRFTMNLAAAQGDPAGLPTDLTKSYNAIASGEIRDDHENFYAIVAHCLIETCFPNRGTGYKKRRRMRYSALDPFYLVVNSRFALCLNPQSP